MYGKTWMLPLLLLAACGGESPGNNSPDAPATIDAPTSSGDGGGDPAAAGDPANGGTYTVTESTASIPGNIAGRTLSSTIYVPAGTGPRPLVIVSPGYQMERTQYASYARHLATWGFVAILTDYGEGGFFPNHTRLAQDVPKVIDWALAQPSLAIDATKIGLAGHSLGGKISVYAATLDARVKSVVGWDPVDSNSPSVVPDRMTMTTAAIAVAGETTNATGGFMPCAPSGNNFQAFYAAAPSPALQLTVNGADHMDWVDDPSCAFCSACDPGTAQPALARTVSRRLTVAWSRRYLLGDTAMDVWLDQPPELAANAIAVQRR